MWRTITAAAAVFCLLSPVAAGKLDRISAEPATAKPAEASSGEDYFHLKLPMTSAVLAAKFAVDHAAIGESVDAAIRSGQDDAAQTTTLSDTLTRIAISYELKLLDAPDHALTAVVDRQGDYVRALMDGDGAAVCAPAIYDGSRELIGRGLWDKYAAQIDATMAAYFEAVALALANPSYVGVMTPEDGALVVAQMAAQGDKALMDHFGVMRKDSPENCPAVLAIIKAAHFIVGDAGIRVRAAQARGASRL